MIKEDYVSFETAKLLKEKGFDEVCWRYWSVSENEIYGTDGIPFQNHELDDDMLAAPTLQMSMKWLRDVHNIHISLRPTFTEDAPYWYNASVHQVEAHRFRDKYFSEHFETYEEACEASIKYCLTNLI